jgi:hypothetical protein
MAEDIGKFTRFAFPCLATPELRKPPAGAHLPKADKSVTRANGIGGDWLAILFFLPALKYMYCKKQ